MSRLKILFFYIFIFTISGPGLSQESPNVIVVLADDIGIGDISHYRKMHSSKIILETPNIDQLAQDGMVFTDAHAPAALCAPSRYAVMTGNSPYRSVSPWGVWSAYAKSAFPPDQLTLGKLMKQAGYTTGFLGKWHLGTSFRSKDNPEEIYVAKGKPRLDVDITEIVAGGPQQNGFDYSLTLPAGIQSVPYAVYENGDWSPLNKDSKIDFITEEKLNKIGVSLEKEEGLGDSNWDPHLVGPLLANKAVNFISENSKKKNPFFMYYCSQAVHLPHTPSKELNGKQIKGTTPSRHMDMIKELDVQMGMMIDELKKQGVYKNTVIIFTSDNGGLSIKETIKSGHKSNDIYRGNKNTPYEGGHRVPFIFSWPKQLKGNQVEDASVLGTDILATLAGITGQQIPEGQAMDSYNLMPLIKKEGKYGSHPYLMVQAGTGKEVMIIEDGWKLIIKIAKKDKSNKTRAPIALFNLNENIEENEKYNLINEKKYQDKVNYLFEKYNTTRDNKIFTGKHNNVYKP